MQGEGTTALRITTGGDRVDVADGSARPGAHASDLTARHPATGLRYVLSPDEDLLYERRPTGPSTPPTASPSSTWSTPGG